MSIKQVKEILFLAFNGMSLAVLNNKDSQKQINLLNLSFININTGEMFELIWDGELKVTIDKFRTCFYCRFSFNILFNGYVL